MRGYLAKKGMRVIHHEGGDRGGSGPGTITHKMVRNRTRSSDKTRLCIEWDSGRTEWVSADQVVEYLEEGK